MAGSIGVLNAGSSSIKFALYKADQSRALMFRGMVERIPWAPRLTASDAEGRQVASRAWTTGQLDHRSSTAEILKLAQELGGGSPVQAVGHRVVHGGTKYATPTRLDPAVLAFLEGLIPLAPLHQPHNLAPIKVIAEAAPHLPQVACFDTAFHRHQPHLAQSFALPRELTEAGVRRYGFHGLSYEFIVTQLRETLPRLAGSRLIVAHLGNGASLCAIRDGKSVASTMGFTAVDGLMMGTRCGALDPGVILYLMNQRGMDAAAIEDLIYNKSGLLGVSGISADMRTLRQSTDPNALEAIALFTYRICREVGSLIASLGGIDAMVFTGGIGENDAETRADVLAGCRWLGVELDPARNGQCVQGKSAQGNGTRGNGTQDKGALRISSGESRVSAWVIPTNEERMIAEHTVSVVRAAS